MSIYVVLVCLFSLQNYSIPGRTLLESMLETWVTCTKQTRCSKLFPGPFFPPGAPYYLGTSTTPDATRKPLSYNQVGVGLFYFFQLKCFSVFTLDWFSRHSVMASYTNQSSFSWRTSNCPCGQSWIHCCFWCPSNGKWIPTADQVSRDNVMSWKRF